MNKCFLILVIFFSSNFSHTQGPNEVGGMVRDAVKKMDEGKFDESLEILAEAKKIEPSNYDVNYEIGYANYALKRYSDVIKIMKKLLKHERLTFHVYQLMGNSYDLMGKPENALKTYDNGLEIFPNSGSLYLEKGNIYWMQKEYGKALAEYEMGIQKEPTFSSNYFRASILYASGSQEMYAMIYGEIFMNIERSSKRTKETGERLYKIYKTEIKIKSAAEFSVSFCNATMEVSADEFSMPFCMIYEPTLILALTGQTEISLESLNTIRENFINIYYSSEHNKKYPIVLFDYHKKIQDAGHFEAYNYWILKAGDEEEYAKWKSDPENGIKWDAFIDWFIENPMEVNAENAFHAAEH